MEVVSPIPVPLPYLPRRMFCPDTGDTIIAHRVSGVDGKTYSKFTTDYDLVTEEELGTGAYGVVVKCKNMIDNQTYAIKKISIGAREETDVYCNYKDLSRESIILATFDHPAIVRYHTTWIEPTFVGSTGGEIDIDKTKPCLYIQQQLCDSTLDKMMQEKVLSKEECADIFYNLVSGLVHIHSFNIMHGDLGRGNVFFCKGEPKIGDFGHSRVIGGADDTIVLGGDIPLYNAPDTVVNAKADVYSLGVMLMEMLLNLRTIQEATEVITKLKKDIPEFPQNFPDVLKKWVTHMLQNDPSNRPSSSDLLDNIREIRKAIKAFVV